MERDAAERDEETREAGGEKLVDVKIDISGEHPALERLVPTNASLESNVSETPSVAEETDDGAEQYQAEPTEQSPEDVATRFDSVIPVMPNVELVAPATVPQSPSDRHSYLLPLQNAPETPAAQNPLHLVFPPDLSTRSASAVESGNLADQKPEERAVPIPRVQVLVSLAGARAALEDVVAEAAKQMAPKFQQLAGAEVKYAAWVRQTEERAANYRLRGPF